MYVCNLSKDSAFVYTSQPALAISSHADTLAVEKIIQGGTLETEIPLINGPIGIGAGCIRRYSDIPKGLSERVDHITFGTFNGTGRELQRFLDHELHKVFELKKVGCAVRISISPRKDDPLESIRSLQNVARSGTQRIDMLEFNTTDLVPEQWEHVLVGTTPFVCPVALKISPELTVVELERIAALAVRYEVAEIITSGAMRERTEQVIKILRRFIDNMESLTLKPEIVGSGGIRSADDVRVFWKAGADHTVQIGMFYKLFKVKGLKEIRRGLGIEP
jgi:hypothetical protein